MNLISCPSYEQLSTNAATFLLQEIKKVLFRRGKVILALPGGRSVAGVLQKLSLGDVDWSKVEIFMIDERVVPPESKDSNYKQATDLLLRKVKAKSYPFSMEKGVNDYTQQFRRAGAHFDIIVLGVGEDGHIAALFPQHPALKVKGKKYIQFNDSPKIPRERITSSPDIIKDADMVILIFSTAVKKNAYELFVNPKIKWKDCPAKIALAAKEVFVFTEFS